MSIKQIIFSNGKVTIYEGHLRVCLKVDTKHRASARYGKPNENYLISKRNVYFRPTLPS